MAWSKHRVFYPPLLSPEGAYSHAKTRMTGECDVVLPDRRGRDVIRFET